MIARRTNFGQGRVFLHVFCVPVPLGMVGTVKQKRYQEKVVEIRKWEVSIDKGKFLEKRRAK